MRTALDYPESSLDVHESKFVAQIREHGWFSTSVFGDEEGPGFTYTSGFWLSVGHPEIIVFGLKSSVAHDILWDAYRDAKDGRAIPLGQPFNGLFANNQACAFPVAKRHYKDHLGWSRFFYEGDDFPCIQLVWPDRAGMFPWQDGFDASFEGDQVDLTEHGWRAALQ